MGRTSRMHKSKLTEKYKDNTCSWRGISCRSRANLVFTTCGFFNFKRRTIFHQIALTIGGLTSNRRGGWARTSAEFMLGAIAGCHSWVPVLGAIAGVPLLGAIVGCHACHCAIAGYHCGVPWLDAIAGRHCWGAVAGCHCWMPFAGWMLATNFGGVHVGCHCWVPCWGAIAGCHCSVLLLGCHCWVPLREKIEPECYTVLRCTFPYIDNKQIGLCYLGSMLVLFLVFLW